MDKTELQLISDAMQCVTDTINLVEGVDKARAKELHTYATALRSRIPVPKPTTVKASKPKGKPNASRT